MNAEMPKLRAAFEAAGFSDVKTVLSSGNVVFTAHRSKESTLERKAEAAMAKTLPTAFLTIVRPIDALREMLAADPFRAFDLPEGAKRIVTFLRDEPSAILALPIEVADSRILAVQGREVFTAYVPTPKGSVFMTLIEKTFGKEVTSRTWESVGKVAR
jgi:uncharacterized protein (DUF1697 family)